MERMEYRYLIYEDFDNDVPTIFNEFCSIFNFKILDYSKYGIHFANNRCELDMTSETGNLQLWLKIKKYNVSEMIPKLSIYKGDKVYNTYKEIVTKKCSKEQMIELTEFLINNFSEELKED